jgi:hypothetical protein
VKSWSVAAVVTLVAGTPALAASSLDELIAERLARSVPYRQAVLQHRVAQQALQRLERFYVPYVTLGVSPPGSTYLFSSEGLSPLAFRPSVLFSNVLGAEIEAGFPVTLALGSSDEADAVTLGNPTLSVTRRLFEESDVQKLNARAALIRARDAEQSAYADTRMQLVSEVFDAWISRRSLDDTLRRLEVAERVRAASRDATAARSLDRAILLARRSLIQAERTSRTTDPRIVEDLSRLYEEIGARFDLWVADLPGAPAVPRSSAAIAATELDLVAAQARRARAFLPFVPNPTLSAALGYDTEAGRVFWGASLQISVPIIDRGERAVAALGRREAAEIERLRLESARASWETTVRGAWDELALLEIDLQVAKLDLEAQQEVTMRTRSLFEGGFVDEEALITSELALSGLELQVAEGLNDYRLQQLRLAQYFAVGSNE